MAKFGRTVKCCAFDRYQSVVIGLTFSHPPADVGYALSLLAGLVVSSKFPFFIKCIGRADTATNSQTSPMLDVGCNFTIMIERGYKTYIGKSIVYLLAAVYLIINWNNPGFQDKLWPYALFSFFAIILFALLGILFFVLRQFKAIGRSVFYKNLGLLNLLFGICDLIIMIRFSIFEMSIICLPLLVIGMVILIDSNKAVY